MAQTPVMVYPAQARICYPRVGIAYRGLVQFIVRIMHMHSHSPYQHRTKFCRPINGRRLAHA